MKHEKFFINIVFAFSSLTGVPARARALSDVRLFFVVFIRINAISNDASRKKVLT